MKHRDLFIAGVLALTACHQTDVYVGDLQEVMVLPAVDNRDIDILFVIDNSGSMLEEQEALIASFPRMMDALADLDGGLPNVHIGVVSTDLGRDTALGVAPDDPSNVDAAGCVGTGDGALLRHDAPELGGALFISDVANEDGTRTRNYTGELRDVFAKIATMPLGCGFEQPLAAMQRALDNPANVDFLRPNANLAVIILTDEDDCSAKAPELFDPSLSPLGPLTSFRCTRFGVTCDDGGSTPEEMATPGAKLNCYSNASSSYVQHVGDYVEYLTNLKGGDPYAVMIGVIANGADALTVELRPPPGGDSPIAQLAHGCVSDRGTSDPAVRLAQFVRAFPHRSVMTSICDADLNFPLTSLGTSARKLAGEPCLDIPLIDTSDSEGLQMRCDVVEGPIGAEALLPQCDATQTTDCWKLTTDHGRCDRGPQNLKLDVTRSTVPSAQRYAHLRCATTATL